MQVVFAVAGAVAGAMLGPWGAWQGAAWGMAIGGMIGGYLYPPEAHGVDIRSLSITSPQKGTVLPVVYGRTRMSGIILWYGGFRSVTDSNKGQPDTKTYKVNLAIGVAEGTVSTLRKMWAGGDEVSDAQMDHITWHVGLAEPTLDAGISSYLDTVPDVNSLTLTPTEFPDPDNEGPPQWYFTPMTQVAATYPYVALAVCNPWVLGGGTSMPNLSFEIERDMADITGDNAALATLGLDGMASSSGGDINPVVCLADFLTHPRYGMGVATTEIHAESFVREAQWCEDNGLFCSPVLDKSDPALSHVEQLLTYFDGILTYSEGYFKLRTRRSPAVETLEATVIDWRDWTAEKPPTLARQVDRQIPNTIAIEYADRVNLYNTAVAERSDDWDVQERGPYRQQTSLPGIKTREVADIMAAKLLWSRVVSPFVLEVGLGPQGMWLEPGDLIRLEGSDFYSVNGAIMRVTGISEEPDGTYTVTAVEER